MKAVWNGTVLAESDETIVIEGNHYFPPESVDRRYLSSSRMRSVCPWKGVASYYSVEVEGERDRDAAWTYRHPFPWIRRIRDHVAFWGGVEIEPSGEAQLPDRQVGPVEGASPPAATAQGAVARTQGGE